MSGDKDANPKISLSLSARPNPSTNGVKRPRATALQDDDEEAHDSPSNGRAQAVTHIANNDRRPTSEAPRVIAPQANRDWREAANTRKRQKSGLPTRSRNAEDGDAIARAVEERKPAFGLIVASRTEGKKETENATARTNGAEEHTSPESGTAAATAPPRAQTDDERAIDALLGKTSTDRTLVVPQTVTEGEAYGADFRAAPDAATLDDYERIPIEQYGAALLRGMGWKDGNELSGRTKPAVLGSGSSGNKDETKRPPGRMSLLGIGAKDEAAITGEMGAWGKAARRDDAKAFTPAMLMNKRTGALYTEEELEQKQAQTEREKYEMEFEEKERERHRRRTENGNSRGNEGRRHDRERDRGRRDDDSDEEYDRRQREKERRKRREREERDSDRDRDRERSRRHHERDEDDRERSRRHRDRDDRDRRRDRDDRNGHRDRDDRDDRDRDRHRGR